MKGKRVERNRGRYKPSLHPYRAKATGSGPKGRPLQPQLVGRVLGATQADPGQAGEHTAVR